MYNKPCQYRNTEYWADGTLRYQYYTSRGILIGTTCSLFKQCFVASTYMVKLLIQQLYVRQQKLLNS